MILDAFKRAAPGRAVEKSAAPLTLANGLGGIAVSGGGMPGARESMGLGAVYACVNLISDSVAKLPEQLKDLNTRETVRSHPLNELLTVRPCEGVTPSQRKKFLTASELLTGNSYEWIVRDPRSLRPVEIIPLPPSLVTCRRDRNGHVWYYVSHPYTGELMVLPEGDVIHNRGFSYDGLHGVSVLSHAAMTVRAGLASQTYAASWYENGGEPSGVLQTDADLSRNVTYTRDGEPVTEPLRNVIRREWETVHSGPGNAHRTAILDSGLKYTALQVSQSDAQFVETSNFTVEDIGRFFGVPLYLLNAGKQSYSSNEQNSIEYVKHALHPKITQYEEERSYKLLTPSEIRSGLWITINMMAELRGDNASRAAWYKTMRETGVFSPNDIAALEDIPDVPGGDTRYASLNYVPLEAFARLSEQRNAQNGGNGNG